MIHNTAEWEAHTNPTHVCPSTNSLVISSHCLFVDELATPRFCVSVSRQEINSVIVDDDFVPPTNSTTRADGQERQYFIHLRTQERESVCVSWDGVGGVLDNMVGVPSASLCDVCRLAVLQIFSPHAARRHPPSLSQKISKIS